MALQEPTSLSMKSTSSSLTSFSAASSSASKFVAVRVPNLTSSFLSRGALQIAQPKRTRCNGHGGGAFGAQMHLFGRFARVIRSYANAFVSSFEDPEKILEQAVLDMNNDLTKMRHATAQVKASHKQLENKWKAAEEEAEAWYRRAKLALANGMEDLAREALKCCKSFKESAKYLKTQLDQQKPVVDDLESGTQLLESKIQEARLKMQTLQSRALAYKTAKKFREMLGESDTSGALAAFEAAERKVLAMEFQVEAANQLSSDDFERQFALLESSWVDDDLAKLKKDLSQSLKTGELEVLLPAVTVVA